MTTTTQTEDKRLAKFKFTWECVNSENGAVVREFKTEELAKKWERRYLKNRALNNDSDSVFFVRPIAR